MRASFFALKGEGRAALRGDWRILVMANGWCFKGLIGVKSTKDYDCGSWVSNANGPELTASYAANLPVWAKLSIRPAPYSIPTS